MTNRFGASSLTALLAVAGMIGLGVVGFRAVNGSPEPAAMTPVADVCPLLGDDCTMDKSEKRSFCCSSEAKAECDGEELATCHGEEKAATCTEKAECDGEELATCHGEEKAATCSKAEKASTCGSQKSN